MFAKVSMTATCPLALKLCDECNTAHTLEKEIWKSCDTCSDYLKFVSVITTVFNEENLL